MLITQAATVLNNTLNAMQWGAIDVSSVAPDLSNLVDVGKTVLDYISDQTNFDSFTKQLIDQVGKVDMVDRTYRSQAPNIMKDSWTYGSILQKVRCELPAADTNETWNLPAHISGGTYPDPFELTPPSVSATFFNSKTTYEVPITLTEIQVREALRSAQDYMRLISMIENRVAMKKTLCNDALIMATINNMAARKIAGTGYVDLLGLWNGASGTDTKADVIGNPQFWRFAALTVSKYKKYLAGASKLYNDGTYITFTPADKLKFIMPTDYARALDTYLYSGTFHENYVKLDGFEEIGYWQGSGEDDDERTIINVDLGAFDYDGDETVGDTTVTADIFAIMFDEEAAVVCNQNDRVTSMYNPRGEYVNYFYKWDALYMNDLKENCVVFTIGTPTITEDES